MLPASHSQAYQEFLVLIQKFQICFDNLDTEVEPLTINQQFPVLQEFFNQRILTLTQEDLDNSLTQVKSLYTEICREFKLLTTDLLFLRASRQTATKEERLTSIRDRITKLIAYIEAILSS
ncbi:MAG: hypothetical protein Kow0049_12910 [Stanieria sp.]